MVNIKESIDATKKGFEESFSKGEFYNKQTQDTNHLKQIMKFLPIKPNMKILDLGTGSGYLSFPIAKEHPEVTVVGLDIVEQALEANRVKTKEENINNLTFTSYDGVEFPFDANEFDMVITRYALHHFPDINKSISEVGRVLKKGGVFFISDPTPNENDDNDKRFVDGYMQLKKDGHIKFYTKEEWNAICRNAGLICKDFFDSSIRFPKKLKTAQGLDELLNRHDKKIVESYDFEIIGDEIYVTEQVNNILFVRG